MGHKTHPLGFRLGITQQHKSAWYSKLSNYSTLIKEDFAIRKIIYDYFIYNSIKSTGVTKIFITRNNKGDKINLEIQTAKPGVIVGELGKGLDILDKNLCNLLPNKKTLINIIEIKDIFNYADLLADMLVLQLENRIPFRRAMKRILEYVQKNRIKGIKIQIAGRLNGAEIARTEWLREGQVPLQTLRADIDYSFKTAQTIYGIIGIKIWIFKGEIL
uniref:Small ribosomal subunit protein uS3c n=1 Tax=Vaucheria litorea TaxID=109269 RepID=B7T1X8_VAULI|nr:ribosomal protein S3 [Vaucheria litorea]ACF70944.1 ribosomal protein S3 [Vaucheria litorea]